MGNEWSYDFYCPADADPRRMIDAVFDEAAEAGYRSTAESGGNGEFAWVTGADFDARCESLDEVKAVLLRSGGCTSVLKRDYVGLSFDLDTKRIGLSSGTRLLPERDGELESDLQTLFESLAQVLNPTYAFSADEWSFEFRLAALGGFDAGLRRFQAAIAGRRAPPTLWWLNYFPQSYFREVERSIQGLKGVSVREHANGVIVQLSARAWEVRTATLGPAGVYRLRED